MTAPEPADPGPKPPRPPAEPTIRVARPPGPGPAKRAEVAADSGSSPGVQYDEPTVDLPGQASVALPRTLTFGSPTPVKVTVSPRPRLPRRHRTWPWIAAVVLTLLVLGVVLLVMLLRGETIDGETDLVGSGGPVVSEVAATIDDWPPAEHH
jgi:hypothetical protein